MTHMRYQYLAIPPARLCEDTNVRQSSSALCRSATISLSSTAHARASSSLGIRHLYLSPHNKGDQTPITCFFTIGFESKARKRASVESQKKLERCHPPTSLFPPHGATQAVSLAQVTAKILQNSKRLTHGAVRAHQVKWKFESVPRHLRLV